MICSARIIDGGRTVQLNVGDYAERFPLADLPTRLAFYEGLRDRDGGRFADLYCAQCAALRALMAQPSEPDARGQSDGPQGGAQDFVGFSKDYRPRWGGKPDGATDQAFPVMPKKSDL